jgi:hypothetical protein
VTWRGTSKTGNGDKPDGGDRRRHAQPLSTAGLSRGRSKGNELGEEGGRRSGSNTTYRGRRIRQFRARARRFHLPALARASHPPPRASPPKFTRLAPRPQTTNPNLVSPLLGGATLFGSRRPGSSTDKVTNIESCSPRVTNIESCSPRAQPGCWAALTNTPHVFLASTPTHAHTTHACDPHPRPRNAECSNDVKRPRTSTVLPVIAPRHNGVHTRSSTASVNWI